jgi:twitching motility protein PilI
MTPFELLQKIANEAMANAAPLPQPQAIKRPWDGIYYRFAKFSLLTPLNEISEIVPCPPLSQIPGVKSWARGIANVRGNLITVIDLAAFLGQRPTQLTPRSRILVINQAGLMSGLLVDEVFGLRHFDYDTQIEEITVPDPALIPYVQGGFVDSDTDQQRIVLSIQILTQTTEFMTIAA